MNRDEIINAIRIVGGRVSIKGEIKSPLGFVLATVDRDKIVTAEGIRIINADIYSIDNNWGNLEFNDKDGKILMSIPRAVRR